MNGRQPATGRAQVPAPPPEALLHARISVWRLLNDARLAALTMLTANRRGGPLHADHQALVDVERFARALTEILIRHDPGRHGRYCPACSTDREPCRWPCPSWQIVLRELDTPPDIPVRPGERPDTWPHWFEEPTGDHRPRNRWRHQ